MEVISCTYIVAVDRDGEFIRILLHTAEKTDHRWIYSSERPHTVKASRTRVLIHICTAFDHDLDKVFVFVQVEDFDKKINNHEVWHHSSMDTGRSDSNCV